MTNLPFKKDVDSRFIDSEAGASRGTVDSAGLRAHAFEGRHGAASSNFTYFAAVFRYLFTHQTQQSEVIA